MKFIFEMYITSRLLLVRVHGKALRQYTDGQTCAFQIGVAIQAG